MRISLHGGDCCGVKHIHQLGNHPTIGKFAARKATKMTSFGQSPYPGGNDMIHYNKRGKLDFFNEAAPQETGKERLERFVQFIKTKRPQGIIEVILNDSQSSWKPILIEMGFVEGPSAKNSNTTSKITIYHLVY